VLSIAKRLVELMGGEIGLSSRVGQGSRFTVSIPSVGHSAPHEIDQVAGLAGRTVLVYDENGFTRRAVRGMLFGWGMQPFNTGKLDNLASLLENQQYDLVVLGLSISQSTPDAARRILGEVRARYEGPLAVLSGVPGWQPPAGSEDDLLLITGLKPARRGHLKGLLRSLLLEMPTPPEQGSTEPADASVLSGLRILAAEDNEFNRLLLRELLESRGASVELAVDGRDALDKASFQPFDLVLMDLHMPELDGARAARGIRKRLGEAAPPIIALTADVFGESHESAGEAEFSAWLLKPIDPERLEATLRDLGIPRDHLPGGKQAGSSGKPIGASLPAELRRRYRAEVRSLCRSARLALTDGDASGLRDTAHDLLGVTGVMGATDLATLAGQLDAAAKAGDVSRCAQLLQAIEQACERRQTDDFAQTS
jgi:two-component system sensor histidine kinase BarA